MNFNNIGEQVNQEIKNAKQGAGVHFVEPEKKALNGFQVDDYFITITKMFRWYGYQTWKDNHIVDYDWCHLETGTDARFKAMTRIYFGGRK